MPGCTAPDPQVESGEMEDGELAVEDNDDKVCFKIVLLAPSSGLHVDIAGSMYRLVQPKNHTS